MVQISRSTITPTSSITVRVYHKTQNVYFFNFVFKSPWSDFRYKRLIFYSVGEIGLDGARFTYTSDHPYNEQEREKILVSPMDLLVEAMEVQFHLAADLHMTVSVHVVQAWGPFMEVLQRIKTSRLNIVFGSSSDKRGMETWNM